MDLIKEQEIKRMKDVSEYSVVTFDIFDTLIKRRCAEPKDVFELVENRLELKYGKTFNFVDERLRAKQRIKKHNKYYNLEDVYRIIELPNDVAETAKKYERLVEIDIAYSNSNVVNLYKKALHENKTIFLISDMYLDRDTIEKILKKCEIFGYERIYISQEEKKDKVSGRLFQKVLMDYNLKPYEVIHIGDNNKGDFLRPRLMGFKTIKIETGYVDIEYNNAHGLKKEYLKQYRLTQNLLQEHWNDNSNEWQKIGYECLGPLMWGFSNWLASQLQERKIKKVFFLAREGDILKKAFEKLYTNDYVLNYLYVSRKSIMVPSFAQKKSFKQITSKISFPKYVSFVEFLDYIGLSYKDVSEQARKHGFNEKTNIEGWKIENNESLEAFFNDVESVAHDTYKKQECLFNRYLDANDFNGNVAIVDIGWNGTMQSALEDLCKNRNVTINGFYFGVNSKNKLSPNSKAYGYIYDQKRNSDYQYYIMGMSGPLEMMTTAKHGTTTGYMDFRGKVEPILGDSEYFSSKYRRETCAIEEMQNGAFNFMNAICKDKYYARMIIDGIVAFQNFYIFGKSPLKKHINMFYGMKEYDSKVEMTMLTKDFKGIKECIRGFWKSSWKIAYMKEKIKLNLPYDKIYKMIRKRRK